VPTCVTHSPFPSTSLVPIPRSRIPTSRISSESRVRIFHLIFFPLLLAFSRSTSPLSLNSEFADALHLAAPLNKWLPISSLAHTHSHSKTFPLCDPLFFWRLRRRLTSFGRLALPASSFFSAHSFFSRRLNFPVLLHSKGVSGEG
jgi:hypothetical protein